MSVRQRVCASCDPQPHGSAPLAVTMTINTNNWLCQYHESFHRFPITIERVSTLSGSNWLVYAFALGKKVKRILRKFPLSNAPSNEISDKRRFVCSFFLVLSISGRSGSRSSGFHPRFVSRQRVLLYNFIFKYYKGSGMILSIKNGLFVLNGYPATLAHYFGH